MPRNNSCSSLARFPPLARAQLTLVEHALCPLDAAVSLRPGCRFETWYAYSDRNRRKSCVRIGTLDGLSAHDELYLWALLSLALSQPEPQPELMATPYWCLRHMGIIDSDKRGGRESELFREALKRLAGIRYQNDAFYDPIRGKHREVAFGFLNYSLRLECTSSRAWRFAWDPIFFEFAQASGGALSFDGKRAPQPILTRVLRCRVRMVSNSFSWRLDVGTLKISEWRGRMVRFRDSGMSVSTFCRTERVSVPSFYQWRKRLERFLPDSSLTRAGFVVGAAGIVVQLPGGTQLQIPAGDVQTMQAAIEALVRADAERSGGAGC